MKDIKGKELTEIIIQEGIPIFLPKKKTGFFQSAIEGNIPGSELQLGMYQKLKKVPFKNIFDNLE